MLLRAGLGAMDDALWQAMQAADCVLVDGTFWTDEEMIRLGLSRKRAREIGHLPQSGPGGMLEWLDRFRQRRAGSSFTSTTPIPFSMRTPPSVPSSSGTASKSRWDGMEIAL